ncbi:hypothetical protein ACIA8G_29455 [Lentzea sp. NPDC051213]|uniref:hypothetical protein n=1 Tax=Lentzea sp. NPDC051213 TaxID=3364126 RepID=UPI00379BB081
MELTRRTRLSLQASVAAVMIGLGSLTTGMAAQAAAAPSVTVASEVAVGWVNEGATETFSVAVPQTGRWKLEFGVSYPETTAKIKSSVDGRGLTDVSVAPQPGTFYTHGYSQCVSLTKGRHSVTVTAAELPSNLPLQVTLVDAAKP